MRRRRCEEELSKSLKGDGSVVLMRVPYETPDTTRPRRQSAGGVSWGKDVLLLGRPEEFSDGVDFAQQTVRDHWVVRLLSVSR